MAPIWLLGLIAAPCAPWLVDQVEHARERLLAAPFVVDCPEPGVVIVVITIPGEAPRQVRLSGFVDHDAWVGSALVSLVEVQRTVVPEEDRAPFVPAVEAPAIAVEKSEPPPIAAATFVARPTLVLVGVELQASVGIEALVAVGSVRIGVGAGRHSTSTSIGRLSATDFTGLLTVPLAIARGDRLALYVEPAVGFGPTWLSGAASNGAKASSTVASVLRASVDLGVELGPYDGGLSVSAGLRVGLRIAPAGRADGADLLAGTGPLWGGYFGVGWSP